MALIKMHIHCRNNFHLKPILHLLMRQSMYNITTPIPTDIIQYRTSPIKTRHMLVKKRGEWYHFISNSFSLCQEPLQKSYLLILLL